jgi:hydrogenase maturation protein HypF
MRPALKIEEKQSVQRLSLTIRGAVQGVGFRPFVYRLAKDLELKGWVNNSPTGVFVDVEGSAHSLESFVLRIEAEKPPRSFIQSLESSILAKVGYSDFEIRPSDPDGKKTAIVLPDISTCEDCLREVFDKQDRRFLYPFTNCTNCGPRFSIIEALPYDRPHTTMKKFEMCNECRAEYEDPLNRRFHAQPNACPVCGPQLELWDKNGNTLSYRHDALQQTAEAIGNGQIVAVKGVGGFHLIADARNDAAVKELRRRKHREEKPLALMFPSLEAVESACEVSAIEQRLLISPESPIVLVRKRNQENSFSKQIAPGNPFLGVMLPYSPLHHLLMDELSFPVVATSGNLSDEPICIDQSEALERLSGIADLFLVHDRPIKRHVDDSIVREMAGRELVLRRARGFAPLPVPINVETPLVLATGAKLKNAIATSAGNQVFISQHIGDLETIQALDAFQDVIQSFERLYEIKPEVITCDVHPDYPSTRYATESALPYIPVQHHYAHVLSCMVENELEAPVLGVALDGTGFGTDGTIWGGEFLRVGETNFDRFAHLRTFGLPGGDKAVKEPRRVAVGLLFEIFGDDVFEMGDIETIQAFRPYEISVMRKMLQNRLNMPVTSSAGRLFDAVSSIIGIRQRAVFEGQAAMELEFSIRDVRTDGAYPFEFQRSKAGALEIDWAPMIKEIITDLASDVSKAEIAAKFHNTIVDISVAVARLAGEKSVVLSGGCFQNKYLTELAVRRLREEGFNPYWHQRVPPNDGGIALGQILATVRNFI